MNNGWSEAGPGHGEARNKLLARAMHKNYVREQTAKGESARDNPSLVPWESLPESLKASNRRFAEGIDAKLDAVGWILVPLGAAEVGAPEIELLDGEIERLAQIEHERWAADLADDGWHLGPERDPVRKEHPCLCRGLNYRKPSARRTVTRCGRYRRCSAGPATQFAALKRPPPPERHPMQPRGSAARARHGSRPRAVASSNLEPNRGKDGREGTNEGPILVPLLLGEIVPKDQKVVRFRRCLVVPDRPVDVTASRSLLAPAPVLKLGQALDLCRSEVENRLLPSGEGVNLAADCLELLVDVVSLSKV